MAANLGNADCVALRVLAVRPVEGGTKQLIRASAEFAKAHVGDETMTAGAIKRYAAIDHHIKSKPYQYRKLQNHPICIKHPSQGAIIPCISRIPLPGAPAD